MNEIKEKTAHPIADGAILIVFFVLLFGMTIWGVLEPDRAFSENENRVLARFPEWDADEFFEGKWMSDFGEYLSDRVPMRDEMVAFHAGIELLMGKGENSGVLLGKDGFLFTREDYPSEENLTKSVQAVAAFARYAKQMGIPTCLAVAGRKIDVESAHLPALYGTDTQDLLWQKLDELGEGEQALTYLNLRQALLDEKDGRALYYRTDHHWNADGAAIAYRAICKAMGLTARPADFFTMTKVSERFFGTTWSASGMHWIGPDEILLPRFAGDEELTCDLGLKEMKGCYDMSKLDTKDQYAVFFGGQYGFLTLRGEGEGRGRLLVIKDSFAHAVVPMLAADYDLDLLDLRYYRGTQGLPAEILESGGYDGVLVLCSTPLLTDPPASADGSLPLQMLTAGLK